MYTNLLTNKREKRSSLIRLAIAHDIKAQICHHTVISRTSNNINPAKILEGENRTGART